MNRQANTQPTDNIQQCCGKCKRPLPNSAVYCPYCGKKQIRSERKYRKRADNSGNVSKLSGNRRKPWVARKNGICIGTFPTRSEAEQALSRVIDLQVTDQYNITFKEVYERWSKSHALTVSSAMTDIYDLSFKMVSQLHDRKMRTIMHSDYQLILDDLAKQDYSQSTCNKVRTLFSQLSKYAANERITAYNAADGLTVSAQQKSVREVFTDEDIEKLQASTDPAAGLLLIMISCGCRPGELFTVPLSNCANDHMIWGSKTRKGKSRVIPIGAEGIDQYQALLLLATMKNGTKLIDGYTGRNHSENNWCKREFQDLMKELGIEGKVPYSARHTFITRSIKAGMPLHVLEDIVGHVDAETTKIYTHLQAADFVKAVTETSTANLSNKKRSMKKVV